MLAVCGEVSLNVQEQKQQARLLEQQGDTPGALEICERVLSQLEGTRDIWPELPLYVKAGDLSLKLDDKAGAIAHYEKAARAYAAYGSSKSVIALSAKILRVNSGRTHVFLRLVRLMIERRHFAEARLVLLEYADKMKLPKAARVLQSYAERPDEELKPLLELVLEMGGRYEYERAQGRGQSLEEEPELDETSVGTVAAELEPPIDKEQKSAGIAEHEAVDATSVSTAQQTEADLESPVEDESEEEIADSGAGEEIDADSEEAQAGAAVPDEDEIQWVDVRPSMRLSQSRGSRRILFHEVEPRTKPKALWFGLAAAAVVVVGGLGLILFQVIPLGGGSGAQPALAVPTESISESADPADALDSSASDEGSSGPLPSGDEGESEEVAESAPTLAPSEPVVPADTIPVPQPELSQANAVERAIPEAPVRTGVMVDGLAVNTRSEFDADGREGYRVIQVLPSGGRLVLDAVYYGDEIASAPGSEEMTLAPLSGDTTMAVIKFGDYSVEARAVISASQLETLLGRLVAVPQ